MDYEKKLALAKEALDSGSYDKETIEYIFPELKESEGEKVKKSLIRLVKAFYDVNFPTPEGFSRKDLLDWLKKQGEQKFEQKFFINDKVVHKATGKIWTIHHYLKDTNSYYVEDNDGLLHHYRESELKLVEQNPADEEMKALLRTEYEKGRADAIAEMQNPAWSAGDETVLNNLIWTLKEDMILTSDRDTYTSWLKSLKNRVQPQPKQEWSEEDEENFARVDYACLKVYGGDSYSSDWLRKFLGIHKKWKPSERQLECLGYAIEKAEKDWSPLINNRIYLTLKALKEQLKKLREE